ncbi:MAG: metal-dependent phosphohydrolase [Novosphingobium sp.]|nr:metal-dependent phosphohydrolase [Novosphingobium sp.]
MLKRVSTGEIDLGMFIHKLEGSWFRHPFWKSKFLLDDPATLASLRGSDVSGVIIDVSRGKDVAVHQPAETRRDAAAAAGRERAASGPPASSNLPTRRPGFVRAPATLPIAREFGRAKRAMGDAMRVVSKTFIEARLGKTVQMHDVEPVLDAIYASVQRNLYAFNGLLRCQNGNEYIYRHSLAVSALMIALARHMRFAPADIRDAGMAGLLMDIGVGQLPVDLSGVGGDYALLRPDLKEQHVLLGYTFLKAAGDIPETVLRVILHHHERLDGSGYPQGLSGLAIEQLSRMAAICDAYDVLVSSAEAGDRLDPAEAIRSLRAQPEKFDATILERLVETIGVYPIGGFVRLRSNRLAMVVDEDLSDPSLPTVRTFWSTALGKRLKGETIVLAHCYGEDAIEGVADLRGLDLPDLDSLRETLMNAACATGLRPAL